MIAALQELETSSAIIRVLSSSSERILRATSAAIPRSRLSIIDSVFTFL